MSAAMSSSLLLAVTLIFIFQEPVFVQTCAQFYWVEWRLTVGTENMHIGVNLQSRITH